MAYSIRLAVEALFEAIVSSKALKNIQYLIIFVYNTYTKV